jgi:hypothetical protein
MGGTRIDQIGQSKLVNISEPLKRRRIEHLTLVGIKTDEDMDWITYFMYTL